MALTKAEIAENIRSQLNFTKIQSIDYPYKGFENEALLAVQNRNSTAVLHHIGARNL